MAVEASPGGPCTLPYPEKFTAAVDFVERTPKGAKALPDETKLVLYALYQQATEGPCTQPKPWGWNIVENAKWQSWKQLGDLSSTEAMRLYVRALEDQEPKWWSMLQHANEEKAALQATADKKAMWPPALAQAAQVATWTPVEGPAAGKGPSPRYDHALARIGTQVYLVGGSCGGRYLGDVWAFDIERLQWRPISCTSAPTGDDQLPAFQPLAGHRLVAWGTTLLCIGGHTKAKQPKRPLTVWCLDTSSMVWSLLDAKGENAPVNRGGHSVALVGSKLFVFGGEDVLRRPLGDLWVLDLESWSWYQPEAAGSPPRDRSAHIATVVRDRWMVVFGGGSLAHCFNDLHVLDTEAMEWMQPDLGGEGVPSARAGCAGGQLGNKWYIMGGGDNTGGCVDMVALDLSQLHTGGAVAWELVENVGTHSPIACEGMGVVSVPTAALLLTFGGYNGKYHNTLHLYQPAAAAPEADVVAGRAASKPLVNGHAAVNAVARTGVDQHHIVAAGRGDSLPPPADSMAGAASEGITTRGDVAMPSTIPELQAALADAMAARDAAVKELTTMRRQLTNAQTALDDAQKTVERVVQNASAVKTQLENESSRAFKLEVEAAELKKQLERTTYLEKELETYRAQATEEGKGKGTGLWGYISGAS